MFLKGNTFLNFPDFLIPNTHLWVAYSMICFAEARRPEMEAALHQTLRLYDGDHRQGFGSASNSCGSGSRVLTYVWILILELIFNNFSSS
jgi:hypothetical protein